jgi:hypothetical protein
MPETDGVLARAQRRVRHAAALAARQQDLVRHLRENGLLAAASTAQYGVSALQRQLEQAEAHKRYCQKQEGVTA